MLFGCQFSVWILFVSAVLVLAQPPTDLPRQYRFRRSFLNVGKSAEFAITDLSENKLYYRIESRFHLVQRAEVFRHPEQKKTARLNADFQVFGAYRGEFSILNEPTNRWVHGVIEQASWLSPRSYKIRWNGYDFNLIKSKEPRTYEFRDENNAVLANYFIHSGVGIWRKFDMRIFSDEYPEALYFLGLAAHDEVLSSKKNGYSNVRK